MTLLSPAAVSCSPNAVMLGRVGFGFWLMGRLGRAWVGACVGAFNGVWVHGDWGVVM